MKPISKIITAVLLTALCSLSALADETVDINIVTNGTGWNFTNSVLTIAQDGIYTIEGNGTPADRRIVVNSNIAGAVNITLNNVNLETGLCAFEIGDDSNVLLTLEGSNTLKSGSERAGLQTGGGSARLEITAASTGSLTATGGTDGAGIGGGYRGAGTNITISGGTVRAQGSNWSAGIGGGRRGTAENITVSGGVVWARGNFGGQGIGGGRESDGVGDLPGINVRIYGGSVDASFNTLSQPYAEDGTTPVYLNTLTVGSSAQANTPVTTGVIDNTVCSETPSGGSYGIRDVTADAAGRVYFYLPATGGNETVTLGAGGAYYSNNYPRTGAHTITLASASSVLAFKLEGITQALSDFGSLEYGYESGDLPPALTVTVRNTGDVATNTLTVTGTDGGSLFTLPETPLDIIPVGSTTSFTVQPKTGKGIGTYTGTVKVTDAGGISALFTVCFTVTPRVVTVTGGTATVMTKPYDGNTDAEVTGLLDFTGPLSGEDFVLNIDYTLSASFDNKNADIGKPVTATVTLQRAAVTNYILDLPNGTDYQLTGDIDKKDITVSGVTATKVYDGDKNFAAADINIGSITLVGNLDDPNLTLVKDDATGNFATANVQNGNIAFSGFALGGTAKGNYTLT
jgi:hypothetical protein